ncbi:hypothetical protein BaRGS_00031438 [Batillaria attramentaria]|uniref:Uncharacterized protein n=1 Tax=Batillaria attramentaria TaxID=370345 RepID=A0ABD0JRF2_9CAEN
MPDKNVVKSRDMRLSITRKVWEEVDGCCRWDSLLLLRKVRTGKAAGWCHLLYYDEEMEKSLTQTKQMQSSLFLQRTRSVGTVFTSHQHNHIACTRLHRHNVFGHSTLLVTTVPAARCFHCGDCNGKPSVTASGQAGVPIHRLHNWGWLSW